MIRISGAGHKAEKNAEKNWRVSESLRAHRRSSLRWRTEKVDVYAASVSELAVLLRGRCGQPDVQLAHIRPGIGRLRRRESSATTLDYVTITDSARHSPPSGSDRPSRFLRPDEPPRTPTSTGQSSPSRRQPELAAADEYEVDDYRRISVPLRSGPAGLGLRICRLAFTGPCPGGRYERDMVEEPQIVRRRRPEIKRQPPTAY